MNGMKIVFIDQTRAKKMREREKCSTQKKHRRSTSERRNSPKKVFRWENECGNELMEAGRGDVGDFCGFSRTLSNVFG